MKQRGGGEFEGRRQRELTSLCTYYAPDTVSALWLSAAFDGRGARSSIKQLFPRLYSYGGTAI